MPRKTTESQKVDLMKARPVAKCNVREARTQLKEIIALAESGTAPASPSILEESSLLPGGGEFAYRGRLTAPPIPRELGTRE